MQSTSEPKIVLILDGLAASAAALEERALPEGLNQPQFRRMDKAVDAAGYNAGDHTVTLTISSEFPVERWDGAEILLHGPENIDTSRLERGISHLYNHNWDILLGRTTGYDITGKKLQVTSKFGTNDDAKKREQDMADGVLPDVSLGYMILEVEVTEDKNGVRTYNVVRWMPYEWSSVTVPADYTVGLDRSAPPVHDVKVRFRKLEADPEDDDSDDEEDDEDEEERKKRELEPPVADPTPSSAPEVSTTNSAQRTQVMDDLQAQNAERITGLRALRTQNPDHFSETQLMDAVANGTTVEAARSAVLDSYIQASQSSSVRSAAASVVEGISPKELQGYSRSGAVRAAINILRPNTFADRSAGQALEVSNAIRKEATERGVTGLGTGILTPGNNNVRFAALNAQERAITSAGSTGAATNVTNVIVPPIELLRARTMCLSLGARMLSGLHGTPSFTRQTAAASSNWLSEGNDAPLSDAAVGAFQMTPHRLSIGNSFYRDFLALSALAIDDFMAQDRDAVLALSLDYAVFAGSGVAPVPTGLLNRTGLGVTLSGATRSQSGVVTPGAGGVPPTFIDLNAMEAAISTSNADISTLRWATTPKVRAAMRSIPQYPGTASGMVMPTSKVGSGGLQEGPLGYDLLASTNMPTNFTVNSVANQHPLVLGCFDQVLIGDWDLNEIIADSITGAASALFKIYEHGYYDTTIRHLESFNVMFVQPS